MKGLIRFPKDEKLPLRHLEVKDLIQEKIQRPVADFVQKEIERQVQMEDLVRWSLDGEVELRPDTTPRTNRSLGAAVWELIHAVTP